MAVLVKDGKILTINGKTIKAPTGGGSNVPLFSPVLTASDKTITLSDTKNGAFVEGYACYMNNNYISDLDSNLDISSYLNENVDTNIFNVKAKGLLADSDKTNDIKYHKILFKNQDDTLLATQIELENEVFEYDGTAPKYEGNFYGWNVNKTAQLRVPSLITAKPITYYAIYTHDFADTMVKVCDFTDFGNTYISCDEIDGIIYILNNDLVYKYDPQNESELPTQIGSFPTRFACTSGRKIYTFVRQTSLLRVFNVDTCQEEESISVTLPQDLYYDNNRFAIDGNTVYFVGALNIIESKMEGYKIIKYDLATNTYTITEKFGTDGLGKIKLFGDDIYMEAGNKIYWYNNNSNAVKQVASTGTQEVYLGDISQLNGKLYSYNTNNGTMLEFAIGEQEVVPKTEMTAKLSLGNNGNYMTSVTIGRVIYYFGNGQIQKYY